MGPRSAILPSALLAMGWPALALAHGLVVFATVDGEEVLVEAKFSNGRPVSAGEVRVLDGEGRELRRIEVTADAPIRFPLGPEAAGGLVVEVSAGDGHENYWILTPQDVATGRAGRGAE